MYRHFNQQTKITRTIAKRRKPIVTAPLRTKEYRRFPKVILPEPGPEQMQLSEALMLRASFRQFSQGASLTKNDISQLSAYTMLQRKRVTPTEGSPDVWRPAPSGGGCYPIELYWVIRKCEGIEPGVYHYNLTKHILEKIDGAQGVTEFAEALVYSFSRNASCYAVLTATWERTTIKYGDRGLKHTLAESGHIMQNMLTIAAARSLGACPLYGMYEDEVENALHIYDGAQESAIYVCALGH